MKGMRSLFFKKPNRFSKLDLSRGITLRHFVTYEEFQGTDHRVIGNLVQIHDRIYSEIHRVTCNFAMRTSYEWGDLLPEMMADET